MGYAPRQAHHCRRPPMCTHHFTSLAKLIHYVAVWTVQLCVETQLCPIMFRPLSSTQCHARFLTLVLGWITRIDQSAAFKNLLETSPKTAYNKVCANSWCTGIPHFTLLFHANSRLIGTNPCKCRTIYLQTGLSVHRHCHYFTHKLACTVSLRMGPTMVSLLQVRTCPTPVQSKEGMCPIQNRAIWST